MFSVKEISKEIGNNQTLERTFRELRRRIKEEEKRQ